MFRLCLDYVYTMFTLCLHYVYTIFRLCLDYVKTMFILFLYYVSTMFRLCYRNTHKYTFCHKIVTNVQILEFKVSIETY